MPPPEERWGELEVVAADGGDTAVPGRGVDAELAELVPTVGHSGSSPRGGLEAAPMPDAGRAVAGEMGCDRAGASDAGAAGALRDDGPG